jgi:hypothetical protein
MPTPVHRQGIDHTLVPADEKRSDDCEVLHDVESSTAVDDDAASSVIDMTTMERQPLTLNDEFAVPRNRPSAWGRTDGQPNSCFTVDPDDDAPHYATVCVCGKCLGAERVGNMPVLWARR